MSTCIPPSSSSLRQRGSALALVLATLLPLVGMVTAFYVRSASELDRYRAHKGTVRATYRALAAMEVARNVVIRSTYDAQGNVVLNGAWGQASLGSLRPAEGSGLAGSGSYVGFDLDTGRKVAFASSASLPANVLPYRLLTSIDLEDDQVGEADDAEDRVDIYTVKLTGSWHMLEASATVAGISRTARLLVRERDPFTRYSVFIDNHYQGIAGTPKGDIHTNQALQIFFPGAEFDDFVSSQDNFQFLIGADWGNTDFGGGYNQASTPIAMPDLNDIQDLEPLAVAPYHIGSGYDDVEIIFDGDEVTIRAENLNSGVTEELFVGPLPPNGVIYAEGNIAAIEGDLCGRVTVATEGETTITGSLRYVDSNGEPRMLGVEDPENYRPNESYAGTSALGIVSNGAVTHHHDVPSDFEVNAAIFSSTGAVGIPGLTFNTKGQYVTAYDPGFQKENFCMLGSVIADKRFVATVVNGSGTVLSGFQEGTVEYDRELLNSPPPHFLEINRPQFKAVEILENIIDV